MQNYNVRLQSEVFNTYRCQRAADSLDIDTKKKSVHELQVTADITTPFAVGLIVGASGSGKTTLAKQIYEEHCFNLTIDETKPIIEQFPNDMTYDDCAAVLAGIGLTSVPCWIRPVNTLSNGQKCRAMAALAMVSNKNVVVIDEWTSVVDRTVAKAMSHCVQKFARQFNKTVVLLSCHYDVVEWLKPDWIIDCNKQHFEDRRSLQQTRREQLQFDIREVGRDTWPYFSKYHYLSENLPGGRIYTFGLFNGINQIGFQCFANYVPTRPNKPITLHFNRIVIHPDYCGLGLGVKLIDFTSKIMNGRGFKIMAKFSSIPVYKALMKSPNWKLTKKEQKLGVTRVGRSMTRKTGFRENISTFSFEYIG